MSRFNGGWIKIHRSILDNVVAKRDLFTFGVFVRLLCMANWRESKTILRGQKITLRAGQVVTGLRELSPDTQEDPYLHKIRNALSYLVLCEAIEQATSNQGRIITICNWEKYQSLDQTEEDTPASEEQEARKQSASEAQHSEEGKKERREEENNTVRSKPFDLEAAYKTYPRKQGKSAGIKRLRQQIKTEQDYQDLLTAIARYRESPDVRRGFVKLFSTFASEWKDWADPETGTSEAPAGESTDYSKVFGGTQ